MRSWHHRLIVIVIAVLLDGPAPPSETAVRFLPDMVRADHSSATVSPDGNEVCWAQFVQGRSSRQILCSRNENGSWTEPTIVSFTGSEDADGDCPVLSPDGQTMLFNSTRPGPADHNRRRERFWTVTRTESGWSDPRPVDMTVNGGHLHWQGSLDRKGNLYFGSERAGTLGRDDIFVARRAASGYARPEPMPAPVNTRGHESMPFIGPDGDYILFSRRYYGADPPDFATGFLVSFKQADGGWTEPQPVPVSGVPQDDIACPFVTRDGKRLIFLILNKEEKSVYQVDASVIWRLRPDS